MDGLRSVRGMTLGSARAALSDAVSQWLAPHGFEPDPESAAHTSYVGKWEGRPIKIQASVRSRGGRRSRRRATGLLVDVLVDTSLRTRLLSHRPKKPLGALGRRVLRWRGLTPVASPNGKGVEFWVAAPEWARSLVNDPNVIATLDFAGALDPTSSLVVRLGPGKLSLSTSTTLDELGGPLPDTWLSAAVKLARLGESLPPPPPVELTWFEKQQERNARRAVVLMALLLVLGLPAALIIGSVVILGSIYLVFGADAVALSLIGFAAVFMPIAMTMAILWFVRRAKSGRAI